jgi:hypothetical protein
MVLTTQEIYHVIAYSKQHAARAEKFLAWLEEETNVRFAMSACAVVATNARGTKCARSVSHGWSFALSAARPRWAPTLISVIATIPTSPGFHSRKMRFATGSGGTVTPKGSPAPRNTLSGCEALAKQGSSNWSPSNAIPQVLRWSCGSWRTV